eukprot:Colp12_sorted_trinity150504_noHs@29024
MKSVGEVMAIGRTFEESLQKALRMVDPKNEGFDARSFPDIDRTLCNPTDQRIFAVAYAMKNLGYSVDKIHDMTKIDKWFLYKLEDIISTEKELETKKLDTLTDKLLKHAKQQGFSDSKIAKCIDSNEMAVRSKRKSSGIVPVVKQIDTLAGEYPASTNYLYTTYNGSTDDVTFDGERGVM